MKNLLKSIFILFGVMIVLALSTNSYFSSQATVSNNQFSTGEWSKKITICHATGSETNPYVEITISENAWPAHQAHGDIYPVPAGGCPTTVQK